jgi:protein-tyrosine phosphatase
MSRSALHVVAPQVFEWSVSRRAVRRLLNRRAVRALHTSGRLTFVCYGNIGRSPFAEHVLRPAVGSGISVTSAGTFPAEDRLSSEDAIAAAAAFGVNLTTHRSRVLDAGAVRAADAIFVFDLRNWLGVMRIDPRACRRMHFVGALAPGGPVQIDDPHGHGREAFVRTYERIQSAIEAAR